MRANELRISLQNQVRVALWSFVVLAVAGFSSVAWVLEAQTSDGPTINISGRQRMLSQRVALMSLRYASTSDPDRRRVAGALLDRAVDEMSQAHRALVEGDRAVGTRPVEEPVTQLYYGDRALDRRVRDYLDDARRLRDLPVAETSPEHPLLLRILAAAERPLLEDLHGVVQAHEARSAERIRWLMMAQILLLVCTVGLIVAEGRLLFRPMVERVWRHTELLEREVSDRKAAEARALLANEVKGRFLAKMSHELRTPLNAIIGYTELLLDELEGLHRRDLGKVLTAGRYLLAMIDDLLDLERAGAKGWHFEFEAVDVESVVEPVIDAVRPRLDRNGTSLGVSVAPGIAPGLCDRRRLQQILLNLVGNAAKFTTDGRVTLAVEATEQGSERWLTVTVSDTGPGIPPDQLERIFAPFVQVDDSSTRCHEGSGLGLAITRELVDGLGGRIRASSVVGRGSEFEITLPWREPRPLPPRDGASPPGA